MEKKDSQSRKWQLTINNPLNYGLNHEEIHSRILTFKSLVYYCLSDEIGENGTFHTHIFIAFSSAVRFSSLKKQFESAHFEMARGTSTENRNYIFKEGKWEKDRKKETNLNETHFEYGDIPIERQGQRNDLQDLYDMIKEGFTNYEILENNSDYILNIEKVEKVRQIIKEEKYKNTFRDLEVTYIYGKTGTGKTRGVVDSFGYENVYRITDYLHPFDGYKGEDVVIFEEFRSSLKIQELLNYLDGYPLSLPARYNNRVACYTKVFIITNIKLIEQYEEIQEKYPETWNALLRRIQKIKKYNSTGIELYSMEDYKLTLDYFKEYKDYNPFLDKKQFKISI